MPKKTPIMRLFIISAALGAPGCGGSGSSDNTQTPAPPSPPLPPTVITQTFTVSVSDIEVRHVATQDRVEVDVSDLTNSLTLTKI